MENFEKCAKRKRKKYFISLCCPKNSKKFNTFLKKGIDLWKKIAYGEGAKKSKKKTNNSALSAIHTYVKLTLVSFFFTFFSCTFPFVSDGVNDKGSQRSDLGLIKDSLRPQQSHFPSFAEKDAVAGLRWWEGGWHYWTACTQAFHLDALLVPLLDGGGQTNSFQQIKPAKSGATSKTLALSLWICGGGLTSLQTATRIEGKFNDILTLVSLIRIVKEECCPMKTII